MEEDEYWTGLFIETEGRHDLDNIFIDISDMESGAHDFEDEANVCGYLTNDEDMLAIESHNVLEVVDQNDKALQDDQSVAMEVDKDDTYAHVDFRESLQGFRAKTLEELEDLYKRHAGALGFDFKKSTERKRGGILSEKYFLCLCEGKSKRLPSPVVLELTKDGKRKRWRRKVPITKTGCKAYIRLKKDKKKGDWEVKHHEMEHNHPFTRTEWQYLNRSERCITKETGATIEEMEKAGLRPTTAFRYMAKSAGGVENVGHTKRDHLNFVNKMRMKNLDGGDAQKVVDKLAKIAEEDPNFYYRVLLDKEGKLAAIFWRDAMMKEDYKLYGDVVVFDTTYNTNRYNLVCAPFVGVNNHWNNVMFACAFICNEKTESFVWVLEKFQKSMGGKAPVSIFTDQDAAIAATIKQFFKDKTRHRLCLWHITQNAQGRFGVLKSNAQFKEDFEHCLRGCVNEEEFEHCWKAMIGKYGLGDNTWFQELYGFKEKWCTALSKDFFSAGFLSSQRSESTNNAICFEATRTTPLHAFFDIFKSTVDRWRETEVEKEHICSRSMPIASLKNGILKHAAEINDPMQRYTLAIFKYFQQEFKALVATTLVVEHSNDAILLFKVAPEEEPLKAEKVTFKNENGNIKVNCSCKHFEEVGWLCFHSLRVLHYCNVTKIPLEYILTRWTKYAKSDVWDAINKENHPSTNAADIITWKQQMARKCNTLLLKSQGNLEARQLVEEVMRNLSLAIREVFAQEAQDGVNPSTSGTSSAVVNSNVPEVLDPDRANTKGRKKKPKNKFERSKPIRPEDYEFGSKSPNIHLF